ncbi:AbrB/MazE/SpoVT family DNA-binding domain-containing protein [Zavarzinia sp.]|uniref:AbrB/MazE/SpoVT family DNA-binding domain-containing protein n=1 Tax=Zavarzinia sp. TaxID=2027920 RepID=UPI003565B5DF
MAAPGKPTTVLSTKGQLILPKAIRDRRQWAAGTRLVVEETPDGVLLRPAPHFPETAADDVFASLPVTGRARTIEEMDAAVLAEAKRRLAGD